MTMQIRRSLLRKCAQSCLARSSYNLRTQWRGVHAAQQRRWNTDTSNTSLDDMFSSIDSLTYRNFHSTQTNLVNDETGRKVTVIPMQHIASAEFFDSVLEEIAKNDHYLCLIEGVLDSVEDLQKQDQLCFQVATDEKFKQSLIPTLDHQATAEEEASMFADYHMPYPPPKELNLKHMEIYFKPRLILSSPLKVKNSDVLREKILEIKDPKDREFFVLNGRTDHCAKVLRAYLEEPLQEYADCPGADSIVVCWGSAHCDDLVDDLVVRGFRVDSTHKREFGWTEDLYAQVCNHSSSNTNDSNFMKILANK